MDKYRLRYHTTLNDYGCLNQVYGDIGSSRNTLS